MAVEKKTRHERIYRFQRKVMAGVAAVVLVLSGGGVLWNNLQSHSASAEANAAHARADFWQVVAGEKEPSEPGSAIRLAVDLHNALETAKDSDELPSGVTEFRAEPTDYPGVVDKLGFNPFDNTGLGCTVCGPLTTQMKTNLALIQDGRIDMLVDQELSGVKRPLTFSVVSIIGWSLLVYGSGSILAVAMAVRRDSRRNGYAPSTVDWRSLGGSDDKYKALSKALGLPYFVIVVPVKRVLGKDYEAVLKKTRMFDDERQLTELQNQVRALPRNSEQREELQKVLYGLRDDIDQQVDDFVSRGHQFVPAKAQAVSDDIAARVHEFQETVQFRRSAVEELRANPKTNPTIADS